MRLWIVRHGIAEDSAASGRDEDRALTTLGKERVGHVAEALKRAGIAPSQVITSPLVRARETAEILRAALLPRQALSVLESLSPDGRPGDVIEDLRLQFRGEPVMLVSHMPNVSVLLAALVGGRAEGFEFKKAAVAEVEFAGGVAAGKGTLTALLPPRAVIIPH